MSPGEMDRYAELSLALAHDVGKYITRAARNLPRGDVPAVLLDMLVADLYLTDGKRNALAVYHALAEASGVGEGTLPPDMREGLELLMTLEAGVRAHDPAAIEQARVTALAVDDACRSFMRAANGGSP
jgi:hypothetical protein